MEKVMILRKMKDKNIII